MDIEEGGYTDPTKTACIGAWSGVEEESITMIINQIWRNWGWADE